MRALMRWVNRWMFCAYTAAPADLAVYRIAYAAFVLLAMAPVGLWLRGLPDAFFSPPVGVAALAHGFPPHGVMLALNAALVAALAMLLVGWRTPAASVATGVLLLALKSWEYSTGKINHDILLVVLPLLLAYSGWGGAFSVDAARRPVPAPERPRPSWPLALMAFTVGLAMFSAGALKLVSGWLDPATHSTYGHLVVNNMGAGRGTWLSALALSTDAGWLWEPADWVATVLELAFLPAMLHPRAMRVAMALACLFHLGVWLLFSIVFDANVLAYAAFVPYAALLARSPRLRALLARPPRRGTAVAAGAAALVLGAAGIGAGRPLEEVLHLQLHEIPVLAAAIVSIAYLARLLRASARGPAAADPAPAAVPADPGD